MGFFDFLKKKKNDDIFSDPLKENDDILNTNKPIDYNKFSAFNEENKPTTPGPEYEQNMNFQNTQSNQFGQYNNTNNQSNNINNEIIIMKKDIELLNEKMNSLKTILESINQRLQNIENNFGDKYRRY